MNRGRKESTGQIIEQIVKLKKDAEFYARENREAYVTETIKEAQSTVKRLTERLDKLSNIKEEGPAIKLVDELFSILFENHKNLDKIENDYTFWEDLNNKFNS